MTINMYLGRMFIWSNFELPLTKTNFLGGVCDLNDLTTFLFYRRLVMPGQFEPRCEKTGLRGFRPGLTQTGLYSHRKELES